ncbi:hypothetical protein [Lamprobacter modestohalophilus]|uniref:hypothetical protein n=1 Tax=Lamprobacter modestohalophilus TaxID=1064514 RepID=UPI001907610C|nr:hypothetical protein [Lamprobacter modestohalophilus]
MIAKLPDFCFHDDPALWVVCFVTGTVEAPSVAGKPEGAAPGNGTCPTAPTPCGTGELADIVIGRSRASNASPTAATGSCHSSRTLSIARCKIRIGVLRGTLTSALARNTPSSQ